MKLPGLLLVLLAAAVPLLTQCEKSTHDMSRHAAGDTTFAKNAFSSLAKGEAAAAAMLDWNTLTIFGRNLGAEYAEITSEVEKEKYRTTFISNFATSFRESGGNINALANWRVVHHDTMKTEVAADSANGVLTIVVMNKDGVDKVVSLNLVK
ncbi:MAG: hypothetical protein V4733_05540 [Verrucomicrobiota bacterium]